MPTRELTKYASQQHPSPYMYPRFNLLSIFTHTAHLLALFLSSCKFVALYPQNTWSVSSGHTPHCSFLAVVFERERERERERDVRSPSLFYCCKETLPCIVRCHKGEMTCRQRSRMNRPHTSVVAVCTSGDSISSALARSIISIAGALIVSSAVLACVLSSSDSAVTSVAVETSVSACVIQ